MSKDPAFLFYPKDWISSTSKMFPEEKGVYIDLLCYQHQNGYLPKDLKRVARIVALSYDEFEKIWEVLKEKFDQTDKGLLNRKLDQEVNRRCQQSITNRINGTFASVIRIADLSKKDYISIKKQFDHNEFRDIPTDCLTERITEWLDVRLKSFGTATGTATGTVTNKNQDNNITNTPQAEFVENFKSLYEEKTGCSYKADKKDFILVANLMKKYSVDELASKATLLAMYCDQGDIWFVSNGYADFTIGNLSRHWNSIVPIQTKEQKEQSRRAKKKEEFDEMERKRNEILGRSV